MFLSHTPEDAENEWATRFMYGNDLYLTITIFI